MKSMVILILSITSLYVNPDSLINLDLINDTYLNLRKLIMLRVDYVIDDQYVVNFFENNFNLVRRYNA
jgi:hypothetical protein